MTLSSLTSLHFSPVAGAPVCRDVRPAAQSPFFASPKKGNRKKGEPDSSPGCAGTLRCSGPAGGSETRPAGSDIFASYSAAPCATRLLITAGEPNTEYRTPQGRAMARPCLAVLSSAVGSRLSGSPCRVAGLSSAAAGGSGRALFERSEFSPTPPDASSARNPAGALTSARLLFAYFLLAKQEKVGALSGAHPDMPPCRASSQKEMSQTC